MYLVYIYTIYYVISSVFPLIKTIHIGQHDALKNDTLNSSHVLFTIEHTNILRYLSTFLQCLYKSERPPDK